MDVLGGIQHGAACAKDGFADGISGLFAQPMRGAHTTQPCRSV
jgi:hypothetical protein